MNQIRGAIRIAILVCLLLLSAVAMLLAAVIPGRVGGVRPALWLGRWIARLGCRVLGVRVRCPDPARLRSAQGLVFPNHSSLLDSLVLLHVTPARFLAAAEVERYPLIGWMVRAVGTVFVARHDQNSRKAARRAVLAAWQASPFPPLVIFPEGRLGPGDRLLPFRYGAFEIAAEQGIPFMPCALRYRPLDVAVWHGGRGEPLWAAAWRLATSPRPVVVEVLPLAAVTPGPQDDAATLAATARAAIAEALDIDLEMEPLTTPAEFYIGRSDV